MKQTLLNTEKIEGKPKSFMLGIYPFTLLLFIFSFTFTSADEFGYNYLVEGENLNPSKDTFLELTDTPSSYTGSGSQCVKVNVGATALEFGSCGNGSGGGGGFSIVQAPYLYNSSTTIFFNGTVLNETIDQRQNPNLTNVAFLNETNVFVGNNTFHNITYFINNITIADPAKISIGGADFLDKFNINGSIDLVHTSTFNDDHGLEIDFLANGFGDGKAIDIVYDTGELANGSDAEAILINIDDFDALGGDVVGVEVITTEGLSKVIGLELGVGVDPVEQISGIFGNMDSVDNNGANDLVAFTTQGNDTTIFASDNDYVTIGKAEKFEEIEWILNTTSSGAGIAPLFYYSTGVNTWNSFVPTDGTNGLRNDGVQLWLDSDIPDWATGTGGEYLIRINRTRNSLATVPIENFVQVASATEYFWNKDGALNVSNVTANEFFIGDGSMLTNINPNLTNVAFVNESNTFSENNTFDQSILFGGNGILFDLGLSGAFGLSHVNHDNITNFAFAQSSAGHTHINAPSGESIGFHINDGGHIAQFNESEATFQIPIYAADNITVNKSLNQQDDNGNYFRVYQSDEFTALPTTYIGCSSFNGNPNVQFCGLLNSLLIVNSSNDRSSVQLGESDASEFAIIEADHATHNVTFRSNNGAYSWEFHDQDVYIDQGLEVGNNVTADTYFGDGSQLTGISTSTENIFDQDLNTTSNVTFDVLNTTSHQTETLFATGDVLFSSEVDGTKWTVTFGDTQSGSITAGSSRALRGGHNGINSGTNFGWVMPCDGSITDLGYAVEITAGTPGFNICAEILVDGTLAFNTCTSTLSFIAQTRNQARDVDTFTQDSVLHARQRNIGTQSGTPNDAYFIVRGYCDD